MNDLVIEVSNLSIEYRTRDKAILAVDDVSLDIRENQILGIVGESGSGKSTLAHSLIGILPSEASVISGEINLNGSDLLKLDQKDLNKIRGKEISIIFQNSLNCLNPTLSILDHLKEVIPRGQKNKKDLCRSLLDEVGIRNSNNVLNMYPHELSGGMKQRIMIAMCLITKPTLLIADEPTTALDVTIQKQILDLLIDIKSKLNSSIIVITHDIDVVASICDRIMVMLNGKAIEKGITEEVFKNPSHIYTKELIKLAAMLKIPN